VKISGNNESLKSDEFGSFTTYMETYPSKEAIDEGIEILVLKEDRYKRFKSGLYLIETSPSILSYVEMSKEQYDAYKK
jgi:hypothetical protein